MLSRLFTIAAAAALMSGGTAALASAASAAPFCLPNACAVSRVTIPGGGSGGHAGGSGDAGSGGNTGPGLGCPTVGQQLACNLGGNPPAPPQHTPTIDVVYQARDKLQPLTPNIHTSPSPRSYVDIRTGLSLDPGDITDPKAQATTPDGAQTVTVIASAPSVTWDTGEGTVTCDGARCGHTYQRSSASRPGGRYTISATVTWHKLTWSCQGDCDAAGGEMDFAVTSPTAAAVLAVGEIQTESRPG